MILETPAEHPFAVYVRILGKGKRGARDLTREEAREAMGMLLDGKVEEAQLGAFLMLLRHKEESAEELAGFTEAIRQRLPTPSVAVDLDWPSYAGKKRHLPWYLLAAKALQKEIESTHWVEDTEADARANGDHERHLETVRRDPALRRIVYLHD